MDEDKTIVKASSGDQTAFMQLFEKHKDFVWNVAYRMVYDFDEAEDLAQEVFIAVWKNLATYQAKSKFSTWLYRITVNRTLNHVTRIKKNDEFNETKVHKFVDENIFMRQNPESAVFELEAEKALAALLARLEPERRMAVILREIEGFSYEEIARATNVKIGTVRSRIARGRDELERYAKEIKKEHGYGNRQDS
ncbi:hypothetical protein MNBD_NITROSPINAE01-646 [hydrothermal vent metagenome]|uniref:RNA polymerase sigma factor n=1 Tax=hydrothermal vent metagenome TaxID=652676 RepID=A0A3B1CTI0_9ZZZZ